MKVNANFSSYQQEEYDHVIRYLNLEMGRNLKATSENVPINFTKDEINLYINRYDCQWFK